MKLLITGAAGQLGQCLCDRLSGYEGFEAAAFSSLDLDIAQKAIVSQKIDENQPDIVVNAAAYTAVDNAEEDRDKAFAVNVTGVKNLAEACAKHSIPLIHVSTDYVFDGESKAPYLPTSETAPIGVYGRTKLLGELAAQEVFENIVVLRTAWVYSEYGNNFVKTMLRLAESRDEINVVDDQIGCPTYAGNIATAILSICSAIGEGKTNRGTYHYVDQPQMSWHEFAERIFSSANELQLLAKQMTVKAIPSKDYPTKAGRPAYSVLDTESSQRDFGIKQAGLVESLTYVLRRLASLS